MIIKYKFKTEEDFIEYVETHRDNSSKIKLDLKGGFLVIKGYDKLDFKYSNENFFFYLHCFQPLFSDGNLLIIEDITYKVILFPIAKLSGIICNVKLEPI